MRQRGATTFAEPEADKTIFFRSYSRRRRLKEVRLELDPRTLEHADLQIHEACSATSAAPTYFRPVMLRGRKYLDGAVWENNP